jgi:hypothetical protein
MNHADYHSSGDDWSFISDASEVPDFVRIQPPGNNGGSLEFTLPDAEAFPGMRITFRHYGGTNYSALINPQSGQQIERSGGTYSLSPHSYMTLQSGVYSGVPGWEVVG